MKTKKPATPNTKKIKAPKSAFSPNELSRLMENTKSAFGMIKAGKPYSVRGRIIAP